MNDLVIKNLAMKLVWLGFFLSTEGVAFSTEERPYFAIGRATLDQNAESSQGIGRLATVVDLGGESITEHFVVGAGLRVYLLDDRDPFEQATDDSRLESSVARAYSIYSEIGARVQFAEQFSAEVLTGLDWIYEADRSVYNCNNCREEKLNLHSGLYIKPRLTYYHGNGTFIGSYYQYFPFEEFDSVLGLTFGYWR